MKYFKILFILLFIYFNFTTIFIVQAVVSETECSTSAPDGSNGTKNVYSSGNGTSFTCDPHNYYNSVTTNYFYNTSCLATSNNDCQTSCGTGFPSGSNDISGTLTCITRDDIPPTTGDIDISLPSGANILANNSQNTTITVDDNGAAPIVSIKAEYERASNCSDNLDLLLTSGTDTLNFFWDISEVKPNIPCDSNGLGGRDYTLRITEVIDEATNSLSVPPYPTYTYHVYANSSVGYIGTRDISPLEQNALQSVNNYASGQVDMPLNITLLDIYSNPIIPAPGINRTIDFHINKNNNSLYLDQYNRTGQSAVIIHNPNGGYRFSSIGANSVDTFIGMLSSDGIYPFSFRVYAPTGNSATGGTVSDIDAEYDINDVTVDITDTTAGGSRVGLSIQNSAINFLFNPLYQTVISGEIETAGFLEGVNQFSDIQILENIIGITSLTTSFDLFTKFSSGTLNGPHTTLSLVLSGSLQPLFTSLRDGTTSLDNLIDPFFDSTKFGNNTIETKLSVPIGATTSLNNHSVFSTHFRYILNHPFFGNLTLNQNSDVIGKNSYFEPLLGDTTMVRGVKVLGTSSSQNDKVHEIITNQITKDIHILGSLDKAYLKQQIRKNTLTFIKNISANQNDGDGDSNFTIKDLSTKTWIETIGGFPTDGKKIYNNKVIYFGKDGSGVSIVSIGDIGTSKMVEGEKTIIIEGMDLYIKSDMYYGDKTKDILGIIVLSDRNGNGGNIYIDPNITNIVGTIYADKSLISYDGINELGGGLSQSTLKNQLHIYGSVFSENTLGGSINGICPSYITNIVNPTAFVNCTSPDFVTRRDEAQKYDLNYLRRYFFDGTAPLNNGKVIGGGTCTSGTCTGGSDYNPNFVRVITNTSDSYIEYPIVIEYNSLQQSSPPPLFGN